MPNCIDKRHPGGNVYKSIHVKELGNVGTFSNLERLNYCRYKGELARNEPRRQIGALPVRITNLDFYPLGHGKPLKGIEKGGAKCPLSFF